MTKGNRAFVTDVKNFSLRAIPKKKATAITMIILSKTKVFSTICVFWQANQSVMCQSSTWLLMPSSIIKELSETYRLVVTPRDKCWIHEIPSFDFRWGSPPIRLIYLCWSSAKSPHSIQLFCACTSEPASRFLKSYFHCTCHFWIWGGSIFQWQIEVKFGQFPMTIFLLSVQHFFRSCYCTNNPLWGQ